ncbi:Cbp1 family collagen-binding glycoprotein adhesin [Sunxiuqinia sp. A32]|uniref:Cbp1 family collagen-binding glycoprotein adhesin n=1 Tax=Sunxiuqinia sp. A32 TaxID=3461496 RepID=UPI004045E938
MNKLVFLIALFALFSCQNKKIDRMQFVQDSIRQVAEEKDSSITSFISVMNEIQMNLDSIRHIQELVKMQTNSGTELRKDTRSDILDDIKILHDLLITNKELVAKLEDDLNSSKNKIGGLQKTIMYLHKQIEEKDTEITELSGKLDKLQLDIAGLNKTITEYKEEEVKKEEIIAEKEKTIERQDIEIHKGYFVCGTLKKLIELGVVEKEGGLFGIGRTIKFKKDFNPNAFTLIDIRELKEISLNSRKVQVITTHPEGSFELIGEETFESLRIIDFQKFWETSRYLVVALD